MISRREFVAGSVISGAALAVGAARGEAQPAEPSPAAQPPAAAPEPAAPAPIDKRYEPVITPNGVALPYKVVDGVKVWHLVAEPIEHEFAPGLRSPCWGYNGRTTGPTIEAVEGDRVRFYVTNKLPEPTSVHWHGIIVPNGMDGVGGLTQRYIRPGETFKYEFTLRYPGTFMYHPHVDEMTQMGMGLMGMFIIHPRRPRRRVDRDFVLLLSEWMIHVGSTRPDPREMTDFNILTINSKAFPGTAPLVVRTGERVRIRLGNLSMNQHPVHLHGYSFQVTATDGGTIPPSARWPQTTVPVPVGSTRDIRFTADAPGDWALHCHKSHHTMNAMGHELPNLIGVDQRAHDGQHDLEARIRALLPSYRAMGRDGMSEHAAHLEHLRGPRNTVPMMGGEGPYGSLEMGGMFTVLKVRDDLTGRADPGWYVPPPGSMAYRVDPGG